MKLDAAGALLATLGCTAAVFGFTQARRTAWLALAHPGLRGGGAGWLASRS